MNINFPHIKYVSPLGTTPPSIYMRYIHCVDLLRSIGDDEFLTKDVYEFREIMYSPNRETPYTKVLVTNDDNGKIIRYDENPDKWLTDQEYKLYLRTNIIKKINDHR